MQSEVISLESFAQRMQISRSTAYAWLTDGKLEAGTHVIRIGRVVRVIWNEELLAHMLSLSVSGD